MIQQSDDKRIQARDYIGDRWSAETTPPVEQLGMPELVKLRVDPPQPIRSAAPGRMAQESRRPCAQWHDHHAHHRAADPRDPGSAALPALRVAMMSQISTVIYDETQVMRLGEIPHEEADGAHWECCRDGNLALCGADLTDATETDEDDPDECGICVDLEVNLPLDCPGCPGMCAKNLLEDL